MFVLAVGTLLAKAVGIEPTDLLLGLLCDVEEGAVVDDTLSVLSKELALGHLRHVVLMQLLAPVTLLTQVTEPVLAHLAVQTARVTVGTRATCFTLAFFKTYAYFGFNLA